MSDKVNVLVVDDIPANLLAMEQVLKSSEYDLTLASSGNDALGKLLEREYACLLLDVQMPEMNGFEVARIIQKDEKLRHIPILFVTAVHQDDEYRLSGCRAGAVDYLYKPIDPEILRSKVAVFANIYLQKRAALQSVEKLSHSSSKLQAFAFEASDELLEPLSSISWFIEMLREHLQSNLDQSSESYMQEVNRGANRMSELIEALLTSFATDSGSLPGTSVDLNSLMGQIASSIREREQEKGQERTLHITWNQLPVLKGVCPLIGQLFQSLIDNAVKFCDRQEPSVEVLYEEQDGAHLFSIIDNGIGFDEQFSEHIFEMFQRLPARKIYEGTGIGLSICREIVKRYGGKIWARSEIGKGSVFYVSLPKEST